MRQIYDVNEWLMMAPLHTEWVYHVGFLARDREVSSVLDQGARMLLTAAFKGEIMLYQRRLGEGKYQYFARKVRDSV